MTLLANAAPGFGDGADRRERSRRSSTTSTCRPAYVAAPTGQTQRDGNASSSRSSARSSSRSSSCTWCSRRSSSRGCTRSRSCCRLPLTLAVRVPERHPLQAGDRHLLDARHPRALRRREEERDPADRSHEPAPRDGHAAARGDPPGEPRSAPAHPDDDRGVRRRHDPARPLARHRLRVQPRDGRRRRRRADPVAAPHARSRRRSPTRSSTTRRRSSPASFDGAPPWRPRRLENKKGFSPSPASN